MLRPFLFTLLATSTAYADVSVGGDGRLESSIPIDVPSFHDIAPSIQLSYSSSAGYGLAGAGWSLRAGGQITRQSATGGIAQNTATDRWLLDGLELVECTSTSTSPGCTTASTAYPGTVINYTTKLESFQRIQLSSDLKATVFTVWNRDGLKSQYTTVDGGVSYQLASVEDLRGHKATYEWKCNQGCELDAIRYGAKNGAPGTEVRLYRESRPDPRVERVANGFWYHGERLRSIVVRNHGQLLRAYAFSYGDSLETRASILTGVQQFGRDASVSATGAITAGSTPPLPKRTFVTPSLAAAGTFELSAETSSPNLFDTSSPALTALAPRYPNGFTINADVQNSGDQLDGVTPNGLLTGDFNGDGREEIMAWGVRDDCTKISFRTYVTDNAGAAPTTLSTQHDAGSTANCQYGMTNARTFRLDVDGDTIDDVVLAIGDELRVYEGRPNGLPAPGFVSAWDRNTHDCVPADVNGDGRQDLVCELPGQIVVRRSTPYGWLVTTQSTSPVLPDHQFLELAAGDVDGDSLDDIILARAASGSTRVVLARSRGDGTFDFPDEQTFAFTGKLATGDVDGDGQLDLMWSRQAGSIFEVDVAVARKGFTTSRWLSVPRQTTSLKSPNLADVDGDGRSDLVGLTATFEMRAQRATSDGMFGALEAALATCPDSQITGEHAQLMAADWNGDGLVDPMCVTHEGDAQFTLIERPGQPRSADRQRWQRADLDGDGRDELVYVAFKNPGYVVHVVSPSTNQHRTFIVNQDPMYPARLRDPDASRWVIADFGSASGPADGKDDLVLVEVINNRIVTTTLLSTGLGTFQVVQQDVAGTTGAARGWFAVTDDHDGRAALLRVTNAVTTTTRVDWLKPTTAGNFAQSTQFYYFNAAPIADRAARRFHPADLDADGLTDLVLVDNVPGSPSTIVRSLRADGAGGFVEAASTFTTSLIGPRAVRIADLDADGAPDLYHVARSGSTTAPCLSITHVAGDGHGGFVPGTHGGTACANATDPLFRRLFESSSSIVALDLDRDGRPELVHATHVRNASGVQQLIVTRIRRDLTGAIPQWRTTSFQPNVPYDLGDAWAWAPYQDSVSGDAGLAYVHPFVSQVLRWRRVRDEVTQFANGIGRVETISYGPLSSGARAYLPSGYTPRVVYGTTTVDQAGSVPTIDSVQYGYVGATWSNEQGRLLGFTTTSANNGRAVRFARYTLGETCGPQMNLLETQDLTGASWGWMTYTYGAVNFPCVPKTVTTVECERTATCRTAKFQQLAYDTKYANVIAVLETADRAPLKITQTAYAPNDSLFIIGKPSSTATYGHDGTAMRLLSMEQFGYDYQAIGTAPTRGERTLSTLWDDQTSRDLKTLFNYDGDGNVVSLTSPGNVLTTFAYDQTYRRYLTATCSALHCTMYDPDLVLGVPSRVIAPNGGNTWTRYDAHGRVIRVEDPRGGTTETEYLDVGSIGWQRIRTKQRDDSPGDGVLWTERYFDGNGRTYLTTREGGATSKVLFADNSERPSAISNIYQWGQITKLYTDYKYDGIGRQIEMRRPDGTTRGTTYEVGARTERDELTVAQRFELDGRGASIRIIDPLNATTQHKRDALGRIIEIVDAFGNVERRAWSTRGLITGTSDPDRGKVENTYTPDGALYTRRDTKQQQQVYKYDALGRLESRNDLDAAYNQVRTLNYTYDDGQAPHDASTGMLVAIDDSQATATISEEYWYDAGALVTQTQRCVDQSCMTEGVTYDIAGRIATRHYPDPSGNVGGEDVQYGYDDAGRLVGVGSYATLGYELDDALSSISYGNGVTQTFGYDLRRRSLDETRVVLPSGDDATFNYQERDPVGRLLRQRVKGFIDVDLSYKYDDIGRLRRVSSPDPSRVEVLNYDAIGRLTDLTGLGTFAYNDPTHVHGMTSTTQGASRGYDANGNVIELADPTRNIVFEWTVDDRIAAARTPNGTYKYAYDFAGRRVRKEAAKSVTQYFGPRIELEGKGKLTTRYFAGNRVVAERTGSDVVYPIEDGSRNVRIITDANGNVTQKNEYTAFGTVMPQGNSAYKRTFAAAETETEDLGLVLMGARTYDPMAGQFLSADSIIPSLARPQSLNRYSYVENDPINYNDPSGHMRLLIELRKLRFEEMEVLPSYEEAMMGIKFVLDLERGANLSDFRWEQLVAIAAQRGYRVAYPKPPKASKDHESPPAHSSSATNHQAGPNSAAATHEPSADAPGADTANPGSGFAPVLGGSLLAKALKDGSLAATGTDGEDKDSATDTNRAILDSDDLKALGAAVVAFIAAATAEAATKTAAGALIVSGEVAAAGVGGFTLGTLAYDGANWVYQNKHRSPFLLEPLDKVTGPLFMGYRTSPEWQLEQWYRAEKWFHDYLMSPVTITTSCPSCRH